MSSVQLDPIESDLTEEPRPSDVARPSLTGVVIGSLIGFMDNGQTPLVIYPGQPGVAAMSARTTVDLHGAHIGREVILTFESGDASRPIVVGCLQPAVGWPLSDRPGQVVVEADGERMVVSARHQLVLRCGKASITLTQEGKVIIQGAYVSTRSTGVNRIRGGSVQLN